MKKGMKVWIQGEQAGPCRGEVMEVLSAAQLPELRGYESLVRQAKSAARYLQIESFVLIKHLDNDRQIFFAALLFTDGSWRDLQGQRLSINHQKYS